MSNFYVPERFKPALERIAALDDPDIESIQQALASAAPALNIQSIIEHVKGSLSKAIPDIESIIQTLSSMNNARASTDIPVEQFVRDIIPPRMVAREEKAFDRAAFERKLISLLSVESLILSAKASDVQHEYERLFISARIMTDVRTVFSQAGTEAVGTMIVHNLTIRYSQEGEFKELFIAMDDADIAKLRKVLDRADTKTAILEGLIKKTDIPYFESK